MNHDMKTMYQSRRARLAEQMETGVALISCAKHSTTDSSIIDKNLEYLTGMTQRDAFLLLAPKGVTILRNETLRTEQVRRGFIVHEVLFVPEQTEHYKILNGTGMNLEEMKEYYGIEAVLDISMLDTVLGEALMRTDLFWINIPQRFMLSQPITEDVILINQIKERYPWVPMRNISEMIHEMRRVKDNYEISCIREAFEIHSRVYEEIMRNLKPGDSEAKGQAIWDYETTMAPANVSGDILYGEESNIVVAAGKNATAAHYMKNNQIIQENDLVLLDSGVSVNGYASDISRTFPASGKFTPRQRELYAIVLEAQDAAIATMKPGSTNYNAHRAVYDVWKKYGLEKYGYGTCGHPVGLNIHDKTGVVSDDDKPFVPGVVMVTEPFLCIPEEGIAIRIEDGVLITEDGHEMLAGPARTIEEVEALCGG